MVIAIIGCGEVGYLYCVALANAGYALQLCAPRPSEKIIKLTENKNITLHNKIDSWLNNVDVVISCTPGSVSLSVVKDAVSFMRNGSVFADFSSSSAKDKREADELAKENNILFTDVVIMGSVDLTGAQTALICAGSGSEKIKALMQSLSTPIRELSNSKVGDAASLKLLRSVFMKGLSALTVECVVAAEYQGIKGLLYEIISDFDKTPLNEFLDMLLLNHVKHACRQQHEIAAAEEQLRSSNLPIQLLPAIKSLFATTCEFTKTNPIKKENLTIAEALAWLIKTRCHKK